MIRVVTTDQPIEYRAWTFPGGERNVEITNVDHVRSADTVGILWSFRGSDEVLDIALLVDAIRTINPSIRLELIIPYMPAARQDRVANTGESFGLRVYVNMIKMCNFDVILVSDPHSDVIAGMFEAGTLSVNTQSDIWAQEIKTRSKQINTALVSPDAGALKKIYQLAKVTQVDVIEATKHRDTATGKITHTSIDSDRVNQYDQLIVVDDICDGGATFNELAKVIKSTGFNGQLVLCVTHGIFSRGVDAVVGYDDIVTAHLMNDDLIEQTTVTESGNLLVNPR